MEDIRVDSGLNEYAFSKTGFSALITECGYIAEADGTLSPETVFTFKPWYFSGIKTIGNGDDAHVFFCGEGFSGKPLSDILSLRTYERASASFAACLAISQASREHRFEEVPGAGGIYASVPGGQTGKISLLFLPPRLFENISACRGRELYSALQGAWISKPLRTPASALSFTAAVIAYRAVTGNLPYPSADETERNADMLDRNYLRLEHAVNGISPALAESIDSALDAPWAARQKKAPQEIPVKALPAGALFTELGLGSSDGTLLTPEHPDALSEELFRKKVDSYYKAKEQQVKTGRAIRRNTAVITGTFLVAAVIAAAAFGKYREDLTKPTSRGLTSSQTVQAFYMGIHTQDVELLSCISSGRDANRYSDTVSQFYVTSKMRDTYQIASAIVTPESWMFFQARDKTPEKRGVFGITSFMIDGSEAVPAVKVPKRGDRTHPVTGGTGAPFAKNATAVHTVRYYLVHTEGENNDFYTEYHTDIVTLTWKGDRWIVTGIKETVQESTTLNSVFLADYQKALETFSGDPAAAVSFLKPQYPWLPDNEVMLKARPN
jgi:hypothetical protein